MNSNLGKVLVEDQNIGYVNDMFIFKLVWDIVRIINGYIKSFLAEKNDIKMN